MKKLLVLLMLMCVASASAQEIAYDWDGETGYVRTNGVLGSGNIFVVTSDIEVTKLGSYNYQSGNQTPTDDDYPIELYEIDALVDQGTTSWSQVTHTAQGTLLASVTIGPATAGDVENIGAAQYITLDSPVILTAGKTYILNMDSSDTYTGISDYLDIVATNVVIGSAISHQNDYFTYQLPGTLADNGILNIGHIDDPTNYWVGGPTMIYGSACVVTVEHSGGKTEVDEKGATTDSFTVVLDGQPTASVTVTLDPPTDDVKLNGAAPNAPVTLTFGTGNWDTPQTVTVMANDDAEGEGEETHSIDISLASTDVGFVCSTSASVTVLDDDQEGVIISESDSATAVAEEGMTTDTYEVALLFGPNADVTITVLDTGEPNQVTLNGVDAPLELTFTAGNWDTPQTVTVKAIDDGDVEEHPHTTSLSHSVSQLGGNQNYNGLPGGNVEVSISENDCGAGPFDASDYDENCITDLSDFAQFSASFLNCSIGSCI